MSTLIDQPPTRSSGRRGKKTLTAKERRRIARKREARKMTFREVMALAEEFGVHLAEDKPLHEVMLETFRRTRALWLQAAARVDELDPDAPPDSANSLWHTEVDAHGNRKIAPSRWLRAET